MVYKNSAARRAFNIGNYIFLSLLAITILIPFINCLALSLSKPAAVRAGQVSLVPIGINMEAYRLIVKDAYFIRSVVNTSFLTTINTSLLIAIALMAGYALQSKHCAHRKAKTIFVLIPMYFSGGLIPSYILISNWLNLRDNLLALIIPVITSSFLIILFRNNIINLPKEMSESAEMDGAGDFTILTRILMPLILPTVIAFIIFNAVGYWNEWFNCMIYIQSPQKYTLQYKLRNILATSSVNMQSIDGLAVSMEDLIHPQNIKMAALLVTILPIMLIYPFLQRYFIHGVIVGALKG